MLLLVTNSWAEEGSPSDRGWGRSHHGSHYDEGPRSRPWLMEGIGKTHFPITSSHPEVQQWFDQGHTLLHGFWYFEAERAFRWCLKLDPDCAMAYWGLARCVQGDTTRRDRFFREALKRTDNLTQRERDYLELWEAKYRVKGEGEEREEAIRDFVKLFDNLLINYPDDIEARALYWLEMLQTTVKPEDRDDHPFRFALDSVLQEVLAADPDHVGALHYRVHNWDGEEGHYALDTCLHLSDVAPRCGHLQHMPGHVLSSIGLWHEAAIAMDAATRVEKEYMQRRMVLPEQNWDYIHNLDYLTYIVEQLGMYEAAAVNCQQLVNGARPTEFSVLGNLAHWAAVRLLIKYERWDDILNPDCPLLQWDDGHATDGLLRAFAEAQAYLGLGALDKAEQKIKEFDLRIAVLTAPVTLPGKLSRWFGGKQKEEPTEEESDDDEFLKNQLMKMIAIKQKELQGKLTFARGNHEEGLRLLKEAAELQADSWRNDPPRDPVFLHNTLGELYLEVGEPEQAVASFEKTLEKVINDGFALSGLVVAHHQLEQTEEAEAAMARLNAVWRDADRDHPWLQRAQATGVKAAAKPNTHKLITERSYQDHVLSRLGNSIWQPPVAPLLKALNAEGEPVTLDDHAGQNVLLIFYLGGQCVHCMEQMAAANALVDELAEMNTVVLAVSKDSVPTIREYQSSDFDVTLLSDPDFANARRFHSYDDFEEIELHSTLLIDAAGRVHWSQHGGEPFMDFDFLKAEIERLNALGT